MENLQLKNIEIDLESQIQKEKNIENNDQKQHRKTQSAIPNLNYKENRLKSIIVEKKELQKPNDNFIDQIENIVDNSKIDKKTKCKNIIKIILKYTISTGFGIFIGQYLNFV